MAFSSTVFLFFFLPLVYGLYRLVPSIKLKNGFLILASPVFYAFGEPVAVLLLLLSAGMNYGFGRLLERDAHRKAVAGISVVCNLSLLVVFKYTDFLIGLVNSVTGLSLPQPHLALPIGISFFTFQAMSYVLDVYKGACKPQKSLFRVLLYLSFFPQLVAGPIVKYYDIEQQITARTITAEETAAGIRRFVLGLSKKLLIANTMAQTADAVFALPTDAIPAPLAWLGAVAYMLQIYFDFSGYSDMAIGLGHLFGFTFLENFRHPYCADSVQDFWRRWHISVSSWFKEYLYIPLGGNRHGKWRTYRNKLLVFFCTGLWHGANLTFVVWGMLHGCFLLLEQRFLPKGDNRPRWWKPIGHCYTLLAVCLTFVIFRADTLSYAGAYLLRMVSPGGGWTAGVALLRETCNPLFAVTLVVACVGALPVGKWLQTKLQSRPALCESAGYGVSLVLLALCVLNLSAASYNPFIYFRF